VLDAAGYVTAVIDGNGHETDFLLDGLGRATVVTDGNGNLTTKMYDAAGNLTGSLRWPRQSDAVPVRCGQSADSDHRRGQQNYCHALRQVGQCYPGDGSEQ